LTKVTRRRETNDEKGVLGTQKKREEKRRGKGAGKGGTRGIGRGNETICQWHRKVVTWGTRAVMKLGGQGWQGYSSLVDCSGQWCEPRKGETDGGLLLGEGCKGP